MERAIQYELLNETVHILASSRSFWWLIHVVCPSKMSLDKATRRRSELLEQHSYCVVQETIGLFFLLFVI